MVVWTCNHCPYALAWHDRLVDVADDYADRGVRFLAVSSNDAERYPAGRSRGDARALRARALAVPVSVRLRPGGGAGLGRAHDPAPVRARSGAADRLRGRPMPTTGTPACAPGGCAKRSTRSSPAMRHRTAPSPSAARSSGRHNDPPAAPLRVRCRRGSWMTARRRLVRVPASSANLGPGYDVLAAALQLELELEVSEPVSSGSKPAPTCRPIAATSACAPSSACTPPTACSSRSAARSHSPAALGSSAAAIVAGLVAADHMYELGTTEMRSTATRSSSKVTPTTLPPRSMAASSSARWPSLGPSCPTGSDRAAGGGGGGPGDSGRHRADRGGRTALPAAIPITDAVANVRARPSWCSGSSARTDPDRARARRPPDTDGPQVALYERSMELLERARELGAVGATISGAGRR